MTSPVTQTLVISDIHIGSTLSCSEDVLAFLKAASFKRLILLGDIFDGIHIYRFKKIDWVLLEYLQKIGKEGKEVVWIKGNHDVIDSKTMAQLQDINFVESYSWQEAGKTYYAIHGHQFDHMAVKNPSIKKVTGAMHSIFAAYMRHKKLASFFDKAHTRARRLSRKISEGAIDYANKNGIDYIFCAHTHIPVCLIAESDNKKPIHYFNSGSWIQEPFSYILIDGQDVKIGNV